MHSQKGFPVAPRLSARRPQALRQLTCRPPSVRRSAQHLPREVLFLADYLFGAGGIPVDPSCRRKESYTTFCGGVGGALLIMKLRRAVRPPRAPQFQRWASSIGVLVAVQDCFHSKRPREDHPANPILKSGGRGDVNKTLHGKPYPSKWCKIYSINGTRKFDTGSRTPQSGARFIPSTEPENSTREAVPLNHFGVPGFFPDRRGAQSNPPEVIGIRAMPESNTSAQCTLHLELLMLF